MDVQRVGTISFAGKVMPQTLTSAEKSATLQAQLDRATKSINDLRVKLEAAVAQGDSKSIKNLEARIAQMQKVANNLRAKIANATEGLDIPLHSTYVSDNKAGALDFLNRADKVMKKTPYPDQMRRIRQDYVNQHLHSYPKEGLVNWDK